MKHFCKQKNEIVNYPSCLCSICNGIGAVEIMSEEEVLSFNIKKNEHPFLGESNTTSPKCTICGKESFQH